MKHDDIGLSQRSVGYLCDFDAMGCLTIAVLQTWRGPRPLSVALGFSEACVGCSTTLLLNCSYAPGSHENERSSEKSISGTNVPGNGKSWERKFLGTKGPGNESSQERKALGTKVPGNKRSRERMFSGTNVPHRDYSFLGTKGLEYEKSVIQQWINNALLSV